MKLRNSKTWLAVAGLIATTLVLGTPVLKAQTATGVLEICKANDVTNPVSTGATFTFTVSGPTTPASPFTVIAPAPGGNPICTGPITATAGTVTITESAVAGTGVNLITAVGPLPAQDNRLVLSNLANRTASVTVVPGDASTQTLATFRNFTVPTGVLEVCKYAAAGETISAGTSFSFTVSGLPGTFTAPVGACTGPLTVQAGSVTVMEVAQLGFQLVDVDTLPPDRLVSKNIPGGSAVVTVVAGNVSTETVARFFNKPVTGQLKICKIAGTGVAVTTAFTISANGVSYTVPAGPASENGFCVLDGTFPVGTVVTVQETVRTGFALGSITVNPPDRQSVAPNLGTGTVVVKIGTGFTEVAFTNNLVPTTFGQLKICKIAGAGITVGTNFTITAGSQAYTVPAGPASEGGYCILDGTFPVGTAVTVTETIPTADLVSAITVAPADRGGAPNLTTGSVIVTIGTGFTEVAFTNIVKPPATGTLQICKVAGAGITAGTNFSFTVSGTGVTTTPIIVAAGACSTASFLTFPVSTVLTVTETIPSGDVITSITGGTGPNLTAGTVGVTIMAAPSIVTFTNTRPGSLKVCKVAGSGVAVGTNFTFALSGTGLATSPTSVMVAAGAGPAGNCSSLISEPAGAVVTVTETTVPGGITVSPSVAQTVTIAAGTTSTVTFTNLVLQACSPGFFKNHPNVTTAGGVLLSSLGFTGTLGTVTVQDALSLKGGGLDALARAAAAAFLNEVASGISITQAEADISALVKAGNQAALEQRINDSVCTIPGGPATPQH